MPTVLLTGFPGFLASSLLPKLLARVDPDTRVSCLIQSHYRSLAERRAAEIVGTNADWAKRLELVDGDITRTGLGLSMNGDGHFRETREVYHFAAIYDLAVPRPFGMKVNVEGTVNVLDFIAECPRFERLHYVSTCYVSGRAPGRFTENDLSVGQRFNNFYEETKYLAEVEVQNRMKRGLNATIYRPSIVVGDSHTGATQKYDGPYGALVWILKWSTIAPMVAIGDTRRFHINVVPRDFVMSAIGHLSGLSISQRKVYQLCDPNPPTVDDIYRIFSAATGRRILRIPALSAVAKGCLQYVPGLYRWMKILPESVDYFTQPTEYTCDNVLHDLAGTGIACPLFADYARNLVEFVEAHPDIASKGLQ